MRLTVKSLAHQTVVNIIEEHPSQNNYQRDHSTVKNKTNDPHTVKASAGYIALGAVI